MPHIIVQMDLPVDLVCINSPKKQDSIARLAAKHEQSAVQSNLPTYHFKERMLFRCLWYDQVDII